MTSVWEAMAQGLYRAYCTRYKDQGKVILSVEQTYTAPLINPASSRRSRAHQIAGKIDVVYQDEQGNLLVMDHKSTSDDISDPGSAYWRQLAIEGQMSQYIYLLWLHGVKVEAAVWDVVRKAGIRPRNLTKAELTDLTFIGVYCGQLFTSDEIQEALGTGKETFPLYSQRVYQAACEEPEKYFVRKRITRTQDDITQYAAELWEQSLDLLHTRSTGHHTRHSGACLNYGSPCRFLGVCSGYDSLDSGNWRTRENVHPELPILQGDTRNLITHSRLRTFQTCRQKHYLSYEMGIERNEDDRSDALIFGELWHQLMEQHFTHLQETHTDAVATTAR